jgi:hypothetical protein
VLTSFSQINVWGVVAAIVANFILGGVYFGALISKLYPIAMGRENEPPQKPSGLMIVGPLICNIIMMTANALFIAMLNVQSVGDGLIFGGLIAVGYLIPMTMTIAINPNFPRPFLYTLIIAPYFVTSSLLGSAIIVAVGQ